MGIVLVHMPWGALERPALGISLLKAGLARDGVPCEIRYFNMVFADCVDADRYNEIVHEMPHIAFVGEWLFTEALYGADAGRDDSYVAEILRGEWRIPEDRISWILEMRRHIGPFLDRLLEEYEWRPNDLVGFTSTFEQNIASLALAKRLKEKYPGIRIAFGGANWEASMGQELHRAFPFVDFACSGEADFAFPRIVKALQAEESQHTLLLASIPGLVWRKDGATIANEGVEVVTTMDVLPTPDFSDYFARRAASKAASSVAPVLLFETSRGCWWGAKSHCTFCGLNGHTMSYRSKSPARVLEELEELIERWPCPTLEAVDNILDMKYFDTVMPVLEGMDLPGPVFYEVKANLKRHHVAALKRAQITRIQPGIESLSDHILKLMRKGTTALRNVQLLKWCREYGVSVDWNLLYGFPGETDEDYAAISELLPRIRHLQQAGACGPIRLDRFSPYFERPEMFGIASKRPLPVYRYLYPQDGFRIDRVAYYFQFEYSPGMEASPAALHATQLTESLRSVVGQGSLQALVHRDGGLHLADTRKDAKLRALKLSPFERCIVMRIDSIATVGQVIESLGKKFPGQAFDETNIREFLDGLVKLEMALKDDQGHYLGLALMPATLRHELECASRYSGENPLPKANARRASRAA